MPNQTAAGVVGAHRLENDEHSHSRFLAHHFQSSEQQFDSGKLGMWLFLITEVMFFSGLFCAYAVYRSTHPEIFIYAHQFLDANLGATNTIVLLCSSLTMALAVRSAQTSEQKLLVVYLTLTLIFAAVFLSIKYVEYSHKWHAGLLWAGDFHPVASHEHAHDGAGQGAGKTMVMPRDVGVFFSIYYALTGLHGIHILGGMGAITWILIRAVRGDFTAEYYAPVDFVGLYWHLVDLIWIFLFPLLYLIH